MVTNKKKVLLFDNDKKNKKENKKFDHVRGFTHCKSLPIKSLQLIQNYTCKQTELF